MMKPDHAPARAKTVFAVFTDFDGTLVGLAARPEDVDLPAGLADSLLALQRRLQGALAIVTGRPLAAIDRFMAPQRFVVAGSHGMERRLAGGTMAPADPALIAAGKRIGAQLEKLAETNGRLALEIKPGAVALHFRQAPELEAMCRAAVDAAVRDEPLFTVIAGKKVFEARPRGVSKGTAVAAFMAEAPFAGRVPVFIGDDVTDEDGFAAVQARGGLGIKVGEGKTMAQVRLADIAAVGRLVAAFGDDGPLDSIEAIADWAGAPEAVPS